MSLGRAVLVLDLCDEYMISVSTGVYRVALLRFTEMGGADAAWV